MGLFFTCLSIILTFFSPEELAPSLAPFHLALLMMGFGMAASLPTLAMRPVRALQAPQYLLMLGFWLSVILSNLAHFKIGWSYDAFYHFAPAAFFFFLVHVNAYSLRRIKIVIATVIFCALGIGLQAILAYHTGYLGDQLLLYPFNDFRALVGNRVRGFGILQDPNDFAQFLLVCFACLGFFWRRKRPTTNFLLCLPIAGVLLYAMYLTFSRGGLIGLGAIVFFALYKRGQHLVAFTTAGISLAALYVLGFTGNREITMDAGATRLISWGAGISGLVHNPLFGVGYGQFTKQLNDITAHNSFVLCYAELGLVGYFFWLALIFVSMSSLWSLTVASGAGGNTPENADYSACVRTMLAAFFVFLTVGWFISRTYAELLYILLGAAASIVQLHAKEIPVEKRRSGRWIPRVVALEFASIVLTYAFIRLRSL